MKPLHLLMTSESRAWSGGAAQVLALAKGLRARGCRVQAACPPGGELWSRLEEEGFELFGFEPFQDYDLASAWRLAKLVARVRPDLVHAHHPKAHAVSLLASHLGADRPLVVTRRVSFRVGWNPFSRYKYGSSRVAAYIAVAEDIKERLVEAGIAPSRVEVIPSGTDLGSFSPGRPDEAVSRELASGGLPVVGKIGHHGPWKGQDVFLNAAAEVLRRRPAVFVLVGRETDGPELKGLAEKLGIADSVRLLGFRRDVPKLLSVMDVCVNAAVSGEGISGALREALAMGVPVVASDAGGNRELVRDGETGELFPAGDSSALAGKISRLLDEPARAGRLAAAGRELVKERFGADRTVERTLELYRKVLGLGSERTLSSTGASAR